MVLKSGCFHPIPSASETVKPRRRQLGHPSHDTKEFSEIFFTNKPFDGAKVKDDLVLKR